MTVFFFFFVVVVLSWSTVALEKDMDELSNIKKLYETMEKDKVESELIILGDEEIHLVFSICPLRESISLSPVLQVD